MNRKLIGGDECCYQQNNLNITNVLLIAIMLIMTFKTSMQLTYVSTPQAYSYISTHISSPHSLETLSSKSEYDPPPDDNEILFPNMNPGNGFNNHSALLPSPEPESYDDLCIGFTVTEKDPRLRDSVKVAAIEPQAYIDPWESLKSQIGNDDISFNDYNLQRYDLPNVYYGNIDYSSFQPFMDYRAVTNKRSSAYQITRASVCYTDDAGLRRYPTTEDQFRINGEDDYIIALGTYYKTKGLCGERYLIVTTTGMYTAITGDEKADAHTDSYGMFSKHGARAGVIEWIVDQPRLSDTVRRSGSVSDCQTKAIQGDILYIYKIN